MVDNGLITWLPTLYKQVLQLPLQTSLACGWNTSSVGVNGAARTGCSRWFRSASAAAASSCLSRPWASHPVVRLGGAEFIASKYVVDALQHFAEGEAAEAA